MARLGEIPRGVVERVRVEAPARLHMGFLSARGERRWAGIGLAIEEPRTVIEVEELEGEGWEYEGLRPELAAEIARRASERLSLRGGYRIVIRSAAPPHVGLGSTTQLSLSVWAALSVMSRSEPSIEEAARLGLCGARSWVGIAAFRSGGFVLDLGAGADGSHPCLTLQFPAEWAVVLCIPRGARGPSGETEEERLERLSYSPSTEDRLRTILLSELLPGILERDLRLFGHGLETMQGLIGEEFRSLQGGVYNPSSSRWVLAMKSVGLVGVGQSSWGPTLYGFAEGWEEGVEAADRLAKGGGIDVLVTRASNRGAVVGRL